MTGLVDIIRLSPESDAIFDTLRQFRQNEQGQQPLTTIHHHDCNGYCRLADWNWWSKNSMINPLHIYFVKWIKGIYYPFYPCY